MSDTTTNGIRVQIETDFVHHQSNPAENTFIYSYQVEITNNSSEEVTLISRHWIITNAFGKVQEVRGLGVVGETPTIYPGESYQYTSMCPLDTEWGTMEGTYQMQKNNGEIFDALIERFLLSYTINVKH